MMTLLLVVAMAAVAVGCGGSDGDVASGDAGEDLTSTTVSASSLGRLEFIKKVNVICRIGAFDAVEGGPPSGGPPAKTLPEQVDTVMVPAFTRVADEVQQLGAPRGDEAEIEAFLAALRKDIASLDQNSASQKTLGKLQYEFEASSDLARPYGIRACAYLKRGVTPQRAREIRKERRERKEALQNR